MSPSRAMTFDHIQTEHTGYSAVVAWVTVADLISGERAERAVGPQPLSLYEDQSFGTNGCATWLVKIESPIGSKP